jgi:hypothetical protein
VQAVAAALVPSRDLAGHSVRTGATKPSERGALAGRLEELDRRLAAAVESTDDVS